MLDFHNYSIGNQLFCSLKFLLITYTILYSGSWCYTKSFYGNHGSRQASSCASFWVYFSYAVAFSYHVDLSSSQNFHVMYSTNLIVTVATHFGLMQLHYKICRTEFRSRSKSISFQSSTHGGVACDFIFCLYIFDAGICASSLFFHFFPHYIGKNFTNH